MDEKLFKKMIRTLESHANVPEGIEINSPYIAEALGLMRPGEGEVEPGAEDSFTNSPPEDYANWLCYVNHLNATSLEKAIDGSLYFVAYYRHDERYNILCRLPSSEERAYNGAQAFWMATFNPDHTVATSTGPTARMGDVKTLLKSKWLNEFLARYTAMYLTDFIGIYKDKPSQKRPIRQLWELLVRLGNKQPEYHPPPEPEP